MSLTEPALLLRVHHSLLSLYAPTVSISPESHSKTSCRSKPSRPTKPVDLVTVSRHPAKLHFNSQRVDDDLRNSAALHKARLVDSPRQATLTAVERVRYLVVVAVQEVDTVNFLNAAHFDRDRVAVLLQRTHTPTVAVRDDAVVVRVEYVA